MAAKLYVQPANAEPFAVPIGNTATIGRTRENTVRLNFSPLVSRQHAIIRCHNGYQYQIIDLGSRNGTFVNGQRVVLPVPLQDGALIRIADNTLTFAEEVDETTEEHSQVTVAGSLAGGALQSRAVALLVCDIRGFSAMSEKTAGSDMAQLLGLWFRETGNLVTASGGTIDKFIGDAVLAYWGGARDGPSDCGTAFEAGLKMLALAAERTWSGGEPFRVAVALHYGKVTCSNVGLAAERDATIIGDAVNTVFRLEGIAKEVAQTLVLSGELAEHLPEHRQRLEDLGERALKGKQQGVRVFGLR
ncbi:MAG: FHA domain-containing protein [Verrucomicrobiota bacterium]|nr:FHA domain-containing protein [Verrucomicrobiota bacterium]